MSLIHVVEAEGQQFVTHDYKVKDGTFLMRRCEYDEDGEYCSYNERIPCKIINSYLLEINAKFVMNPDDTKHAIYMSGGFMSINKLGYTYSVVILRYPAPSKYFSQKLYESDVVYSECGLKETNFDMYSYHHNEPEFHYDESRLEYEVEQSLNLRKILLNDQE